MVESSRYHPHSHIVAPVPGDEDSHQRVSNWRQWLTLEAVEPVVVVPLGRTFDRDGCQKCIPLDSAKRQPPSRLKLERGHPNLVLRASPFPDVTNLFPTSSL